MVPNPVSANTILEDPIRDAAIHFGAFLQLKGLLEVGNNGYGIIETSVLLDEFTNNYQPEYRTYLVRSELLLKLLKYRVAKRLRKKKDQQTIRINVHPNPDQVKAPNSVPRPRLYVDQTRVLRDRLVRSNVINDGSCMLCHVTFSSEQIRQEHVESDIHKFRLQYRENRSSFTSSVGGASMTVADIDSETDVILRCNKRRDITVKVALDSSYKSANIYKIIDLSEVYAKPTKFQNDTPIEVKVSAMFEQPGAYIYPLVAKIMPVRLCLLRDLIFRVESELMDQLAPISPFIKRQDVIKEMEGAILPGEEVKHGASNLKKVFMLGSHNIPAVYTKLVMRKLEKFENITPNEENALSKILELLCGTLSYREAMQQVGQTKAPFIEPLSINNYSERFRLLLDLEELQQHRQVKNYDRSNETLYQCNSRFILKVPDLSEGRPSVSKSDKVYVRLQDDNTVRYEGIIHEVQENGLLLGFHNKFREEYNRLKSSGVRNPKVDVRFTVNRFPILNMHRALSLMSKHRAHSIAFPKRSGTYLPPTRAPTLRSWVNPLIESNPEQQLAVRKIISKSSGNSPYLVFGPPGTGKTVTLVETIMQVWHNRKKHAAKQLVCAPSNSACNNITDRLVAGLADAKILRLFSISADLRNVSAVILKHSNYNDFDGSINFPSLEEILAHDIIVVTIVCAGRLVTGGASGKFHFVYIDECGQASEPESLIAIAGILTTNVCTSTGQLVLAGDPQQLGPILSSQLANDFGLGMSLLERLMKHVDLYKKGPSLRYDDQFLTKLVQNFRSHPAILHVPNNLFYDNELTVKGNPDIINKAVGWEVLPNPLFPLIFHGIQGIDERESNSPSYFNRQEIDQVIIYLKKLFKLGLPKGYKVKNEDIGIITPYRKQVQKFRKAFELLGWKDIRVGSVEEFQGSEKLIVFISTVRSNVALVEEDYRFKLGFLKNPKRFNVSVTRAQALLIVVGNPMILRYDKQWYQLLDYCRQNNAAIGIPFPDYRPLEHQDEHISG